MSIFAYDKLFLSVQQHTSYYTVYLHFNFLGKAHSTLAQFLFMFTFLGHIFLLIIIFLRHIIILMLTFFSYGFFLMLIFLGHILLLVFIFLGHIFFYLCVYF